MLRLIKYFHHFNNNRAYIQCLLAVGQNSNTKKTSLEHSAVSGRREAPGLRSRRDCHHRCALLRYMPPGRHQQQSIKNQSSLPQRKSSQHPPHISPGIQCLQFIQTVRIQGSAILRGNHNSLSLAPPLPPTKFAVMGSAAHDVIPPPSQVRAAAAARVLSPRLPVSMCCEFAGSLAASRLRCRRAASVRYARAFPVLHHYVCAQMYISLPRFF